MAANVDKLAHKFDVEGETPLHDESPFLTARSRPAGGTYYERNLNDFRSP